MESALSGVWVVFRAGVRAIRLLSVALLWIATALLVYTGLAAVIWYTVFVPDAHVASLQDHPVLGAHSDTAEALQIVALGDSYMSGEGAPRFFGGTDRGPSDSCRRAPTAYPVLVAEQLAKETPKPWSGVHLTFAACSGARTVNMGSTFTDPDAHVLLQNRSERQQMSQLRAHQDADVVILGMGGNDAGFSNVVLTCGGKQVNCQELADQWLAALDPGSDVGANQESDGVAFVEQKLRDVMHEARAVAPHARYYVTTYPNPISASRCADVGMSKPETAFLTEDFLPQLNDEIKLAAAIEGFEVIDLTRVFAKDGLCAHGQHHANGRAMNAWHVQRIDNFKASINDLLRGSLHPTPFGHQLIAKEVLATITPELLKPAPNVPAQTAPCADGSDLPPPGGPSSGPPGAPTELPPAPPSAPPTQKAPDCQRLQFPPGPPPRNVPVPEGPWELRANPCTKVAQRQENLERPQGPVTVFGAKPGTTVCYAGYDDDFKTGQVASAGTFKAPRDTSNVSGLGGRREVIYQLPDGNWVWRIENASPDAPPSTLNVFDAWLGLRNGPGTLLRFGLVGLLILCGSLLLLGAVALGVRGVLKRIRDAVAGAETG